MTQHLLADPRITAVGLFTEAFSGLTARLATQFAEHGLSTVEFEVLVRLARSPGRRLRMTDLSAQTSLSTSGVTRVVDRLERDGLVCRNACPTDRRSSFAVVTPPGLSRLCEVLPGHLDLIERWFTGLLPADRLAGLLDTLRTVRDAVRPDATAGACTATGDGGCTGTDDAATRPAEVPAEPPRQAPHSADYPDNRDVPAG